MIENSRIEKKIQPACSKSGRGRLHKAGIAFATDDNPGDGDLVDLLAPPEVRRSALRQRFPANRPATARLPLSCAFSAHHMTAPMSYRVMPQTTSLAMRKGREPSDDFPKIIHLAHSPRKAGAVEVQWREFERRKLKKREEQGYESISITPKENSNAR